MHIAESINTRARDGQSSARNCVTSINKVYPVESDPAALVGRRRTIGGQGTIEDRTRTMSSR